MSSAMTGVGRPWKGAFSLLAVLALSLLLYSRRFPLYWGLLLLLALTSGAAVAAHCAFLLRRGDLQNASQGIDAEETLAAINAARSVTVVR